MLFKLLIALVKISLTAALICLTELIISNYLIIQRFKKKTPHLPIAPNKSLLTGHWGDVTYRRGTYDVPEQNHQKLGKTFAVFLGKTVFVSTVDLDFIKRVVLDDENTDRSYPPIPVHEIDQDSIVTSNGSQWKRIRRAFSPALS